jgi:hypothetical protein
MSCKNDDNWQESGSYTKKDDCVIWMKLVEIRLKYNSIWDILKREERQAGGLSLEGRKYGWELMSYCQDFYDPDSCNGQKGNNRREEVEELAEIKGWIKIELDYPLAGNPVYMPDTPEYENSYEISWIDFIIAPSTILSRLNDFGLADTGGAKCTKEPAKYYYLNPPFNTDGHGEWIVYLKDPCFGCTGFLIYSFSFGGYKKQDLIYRGQEIDVIERYYKHGNVENCPISRHFQPLNYIGAGNQSPGDGTIGGSPGEVIRDWKKVCNFDVEWKVPSSRDKYIKSAINMFPGKIRCFYEDDPFTTKIEHCCGTWLVAHWSEEWDTPDQGSNYKLCPQDEVPATGPVKRWVRRRIKYIDIHPPNGSFTSPNGKTITNSDHTFKGHVTQKIKAFHLNDVWSKIQGTKSGTKLRLCKLEKCEYWANPEDKSKLWVYGDTVEIKGEEETLQQRKSSGKNCDECKDAQVGAPICSCQWDDTDHIVIDFNKQTSCKNILKEGCKKDGEYPGAGPPYLSFGPTDCQNKTPCSECMGTCCYDCKCEQMTEMDCLNVKEAKNLEKAPKVGPKWIGIYGYQDSCDKCKRRGTAKPCGGWKKEDKTEDDISPNVQDFELCGTTAACCFDDGHKEESKHCTCEVLTKCECEEQEGIWQGVEYLEDEPSVKGKGCAHKEVKVKEICGLVSACCFEEKCECTTVTKCKCDKDGGVWQGKKSDPENPGKTCSDEDIKKKPMCGAIGSCCIKDSTGNSSCSEGTECVCKKSKGSWSQGKKCNDNPPPCPGSGGECCGEGGTGCSGVCPGDDCPGGACCCDSKCYNECSDCCDYESARKCCSGDGLKSIFAKSDDPSDSAIFIIDDVINDLSLINDDYDFIANAFDIFIRPGGLYLYEVESVKINNMMRYLSLDVILDLDKEYRETEDKALFFDSIPRILDEIKPIALDFCKNDRKHAVLTGKNINLNVKRDEQEAKKISEKLFTQFNSLKESVYGKLKSRRL